MTRLTELRDRVLAATGPDRELDAEIAFELRWRPENHPSAESFALHEAKHDYATAWIAHAPWRHDWPIPYWTASLDAVVALCELKLPGWVWSVNSPAPYMGQEKAYAILADPEDKGGPEPWNEIHAMNTGSASTPALALLAALLTALAETTDAEVRGDG